jgi:DNA-binding response OmpR family regulator
MANVLVVEDDKPTNDRLCRLAASIPDVVVEQAFHRIEAEQAIQASRFDLAVVDIDLGPELVAEVGRYGGLGILSLLGQRDIVTVVVSGISESNIPQVVRALKAYDFLAKPINDEEFLSRVQHALRWSTTREAARAADAAAHWPASLRPDPEKDPGLLWKDKPVHLSLTELRLVRLLVREPGQPVKTSDLVDTLGTATSSTAVATHLSGVRKKFRNIDPDFKCIRAVPGVGYAWQE